MFAFIRNITGEAIGNQLACSVSGGVFITSSAVHEANKSTNQHSTLTSSNVPFHISQPYYCFNIL